MRVDDGPAVLPERCGGQVIKPRNGLSFPLSTVRVSLPPDGGGKCTGSFTTASPLASRDYLAACCALAALCLCQVWFCFLLTGSAELFYYQGTSSARQFAALLVDTGLLTGVFWALWRLAGLVRKYRTGEVATNVVFLLFLAVPGNAIRVVMQPLTEKLNLDYWRHVSVHGLPWALRLSMWGCLVALAVAIFCRHRQLARLAGRSLILLFPVVPFMLAEATWVLTHPPPGTSLPPRVSINGKEGNRAVGNHAVGNRRAGHASQRFVWIIFDEMDYRLAFESATNLRLPEFNRLASQGLFATSAFPPGGRTMISIPALLSGRLVAGSNAAGPSDLLVRYEGESKAVRWNTQQTVFALQRDRGWRTGVVGWHFPYSRIFGADVDAWQDQTWRLALNPNRPFVGLMSDDFRVLMEGKTRSLVGKSLSVREQQRIVREVGDEATRKAADPSLDLVFLHLPVTHAPFYYDAATGKDAVRLRPVAGYLDHLQLADRVLGQIRRAIDEAGVARRTTLLVSSDHWYREADLLDGGMDHRVPFLVRFPDDSRGLRYSAPFNTIVSRRLATAILDGEIHNAAGAAAWIDRVKGDLTESPYSKN
jgi:hypothetical protein